MNLGVLAAISAPTAGCVVALIALYRAKAQQRLDRASQAQIEANMNKATANRRIMLERYADATMRYHRDLRTYLLQLVDAGIIDATQVDLSKFPRPPQLPVINGD
jgi:hypothetical protein